MTEKEIKKLREGFHRLIEDTQDRKLSTILADLEARIDKRIASFPKNGDGNIMSSVLEKLELLDRRMAAIESSHSPTHGKRITTLEKRAPNRKEIASLRREISSLRSTVNKELNALLPSKELDSHKKAAPKTAIKPLIKGLDERRKKGDDELKKHMRSMEKTVERMMREFTKQINVLKEEHEERLEGHREDVKSLIATEDKGVNKKLNSQFLRWLENLEGTVQERMETQLKQLDTMHKELKHARKQFVKKEDLEEMERHVIEPLEDVNKKVREFVLKEVEKVERDLKKSKAMGVDHKVLQNEIDRVVKSMEEERTALLEQELKRVGKR